MAEPIMKATITWQTNPRAGDPGVSPVIAYYPTPEGSIVVFPSRIGAEPPLGVSGTTRFEDPPDGYREECKLVLARAGNVYFAYPSNELVEESHSYSIISPSGRVEITVLPAWEAVIKAQRHTNRSYTITVTPT